MVKGIFFDLGGTLYSYSGMREVTPLIISHLAERLQVQGELEDCLHHYQEATREADHHYAHQPFYLFRDYFKTTYQNFVRRLDKAHDDDDYDWFSELQERMLLDAMQPKSDCLEVLDKLREKNLYLSVVSNSDDDMLEYLIRKAQLHHRLDHWTSSEAARSCKPDPRFFEVALEKSNLAADQVLFVGDSLEQDILGAHKAGMKTVLISETDDDAPMHIGRETVEPDFHIRELTDLLDIIENP